MLINFTDRVEVGKVVLGVSVEGCHVARLFVPVSVVVVRHHGDPVQVPGNARHIVAHVDDFLSGQVTVLFCIFNPHPVIRFGNFFNF